MPTSSLDYANQLQRAYYRLPDFLRKNFNFAGNFADKAMQHQTLNQTTTDPLTGTFPDPTQYFSDEFIRKLFGEQKAGLGQARASAVAQGQRAGGAQSARLGLANPGAFQSAVSSQINAPYAQAFSKLGAAEAGALQANKQAEFQAQAMKSQFEEAVRQAKTQEEITALELFYRNMFQQQQNYLQKQAQDVDFFDFLGFGTNVASGALPLMFPSKYGYGKK